MCAPARDAPACGRRNAPRRHRAGQGNGGGGGGAGVRKARTGGTTSDTCGERGARLRRASGVAVRRRRRGGRKSEGTRTSGAPRWRATARRRRPRAASALLQACLSAQGGGRRAGLSPTGFFHRWCLFFAAELVRGWTHGRAERRRQGPAEHTSPPPEPTPQRASRTFGQARACAAEPAGHVGERRVPRRSLRQPLPAMAAPSSVVVHPLVLLSVVDHYNRVAKARGAHFLKRAR